MCYNISTEAIAKDRMRDITVCNIQKEVFYENNKFKKKGFVCNVRWNFRNVRHDADTAYS